VTGTRRTLQRADFDLLPNALIEAGYEVIGPRVVAGAIELGPIENSSQLPVGVTDEQDGGTYRLAENGEGSLFGFSTGPQSWKRYLHPPVLSLWKSRRNERGEIEFETETERTPARAFLGVRSCDLHAIAALDDALLRIEHPDEGYRARREASFIVALNCRKAGGTCFCVSTGTGPRAENGFDLAMTEVIEAGNHYFVLEAGSDKGLGVLERLPCREAEPAELERAEAVIAATASEMGRELEVDGLAELLQRNLEHPRFDEVSERCLSCGNCTSVCPTCFCTEVEDVVELTGESAEHRRRWDSCFTLGFTHVHGGNVRHSVSSRYRQWMTHKLSTWTEQFDNSSGCVGCGRCITWCPVAIDITEEAAAIRATDGGKP
jgi:sulfhydrogenase subunit beta (sulfur reductase)